MFNEHNIYPTGKHQLVLSFFILILCIFVGLLVIFAASGYPFYRISSGILMITAGKGYFIWSYFRSVNKKPILKLNPIGIWLERKDKLIPWAMIEHAVIRKSAIENDQLYNSTLEIKFIDSDEILSYPIDDMAIEADELNTILANYQGADID